MQARICSRTEDLELVLVTPGTAVSGHQQTCRGVHVDKTVHDFVHHTDLFFYGTSLNELVTGSDYGRQKVARVYKNCVICTVAFTCGLAVRRYRLVSRRTSVQSVSVLHSLQIVD